MRCSLLLCLLLLSACGPTGVEPPAPTAAPTEAPATTATAAPDETPAAGAEAPLPGDPAAGEPIYQAYCLACHMPDGTGMNGVLAADWVNDMTRRARSDAELLDSIANGVEETTMVAWSAMLTEQQRKDVLAYVRVTYMGHSGKR